MKELRKPFAISETIWRVDRCGVKKNGEPWATILAYLDARSVMNRLDDVVGMAHWKDSYDHLSSGVMCSLSVYCAHRDGQWAWVMKQDGSPETNYESFKGGVSKAFIRAGVKWGIGRYLYDLPTAIFAECSLENKNQNNGWRKAKTKEGVWFYWKVSDVANGLLQKVIDDINKKLNNKKDPIGRYEYILELAATMTKGFSKKDKKAWITNELKLINKSYGIDWELKTFEDLRLLNDSKLDLIIQSYEDYLQEKKK